KEELQAVSFELRSLKSRTDSFDKLLAIAKQEAEDAKKALLASQRSLEEARLENQRLQTLVAELEGAKKALSEVVSQLIAQVNLAKSQASSLAEINNQLSAQNKDLEAQVDRLSARLEASRDLEAKVASLTMANSQLIDQLRVLNEQVAELRASAESSRTLQERFDALRKQYDEALSDVELLTKSNAALRNQEFKIRRQLIGLKGEMKNVVFVVDASGSMNESDGISPRWQNTSKVIKTWLELLDVEKCGLVVFNDQAISFEPEKRLFDLRGSSGEFQRGRMLKFLNELKPGGGTNTLAGLTVAYEHEGVDTIILFTDGAPTSGSNKGFDSNQANAIYRLCQRNPKIPINTIALGNYFTEELATFLKKVVTLTSGEFIGK
ncbi:MAG: VWA domain-containing protein, partial [Planctomycetota bacterium]